MSMKTKLSAVAIASSTLFAAYSGQAAPVIYDNLTDFNNALGSHSLNVEDFESLGDFQPSPYDMGDFVMESAFDLQVSSSGLGTNGPKAVRISEHEDDWIKFTFDTPIQAFSIDIVDALDSGGGDLDVAVDGANFNILTSTSLPNETVLFLGIIDWDGFTTVLIDGSDSGDKIYYDNLQYSSEFVALSSSTSTESVSEPATLAMFGLGLTGLGFVRRRSRA